LGVTDEMMQYLRGNRPDLVVVAELDGVQQEFFNDREKAHMADVRNLFVGAIKLRRIAIGIVIAGILLLLILKRKQAVRILARGYKWACGITAVLALILTCLISTDFNYVFIKFHHIFFDNDLWLLDPYKDDMINMLPEGFFFDTVVRIGITFIIPALVLLVIAAVISRNKKEKPDLV
ncbi:MAG: TIGR01906 family membrane protein, partial [Eubacterium sp.]|nr:TIGR01906 family membrane protein [Eubacterium sp.]